MVLTPFIDSSTVMDGNGAGTLLKALKLSSECNAPLNRTALGTGSGFIYWIPVPTGGYRTVGPGITPEGDLQFYKRTYRFETAR